VAQQPVSDLASEKRPWTWDRLHVLRMLYAGNDLDRAHAELEAYKRKRPRARLTIRQRNRVLKEWPRADVKR